MNRWLLALLCIQPVLYWHGLCGGFVFDDRFLILDTMKTVSPLSMWTGGLWEGGDQANFYRPIFSMSIWVDQQLFGLNPVGYHVHSLLWHMLNIYLFGQVAMRVLGQRQWLVATTVFATHPLMSELVFWISARNDTMAMTFVLLFCTVFWKKSVLDRFDVVCTLTIIFALGTLCKESALILFVPVLLTKGKQTKKLLLSMSIWMVILFGWRSYLGVHTPEMSLENIRMFVGSVDAVLIDGLGRMLFPWRLSPAVPMVWLSLAWWQVLFAIGVVGLLVWTLRCQQVHWLWIVWIGVGVSLAIPAIVYTGNVGDRYWSMGLIAWSLIVAKLIPSRWVWIPIPFWMAMIFLRGLAWESDLNFWTQEVVQMPTPYSHVSLAIIQYNEGDFESAMEGFYQGFQADPPHVDGCAPFVSSVLKVQGARSALEASDWAIERGCAPDGEMMGLRAVIFFGLDRQTDVDAILQMQIDDPTKRLDVVSLARSARLENWTDFCQDLQAWPEPDRLYRQLKSLSPIQFENTDWISEVCTAIPK